MMSTVNVKIIDVTGNKEQEATLPTNAEVRRIAAKLVQMMNLPSTGPDGAPLSYKFYNKSTGKQLSDDQTLADGGVEDGAVLRLQPEVTAG